jgi:pimeloyl-ACP methyl ester carboxylesterase
MFPKFLPPQVQQLSEATSIAMARSIERQGIVTPLLATPIETAFVHPPRPQSAHFRKTPVVLLHGFDSSLLEFRRLLPLLTEQDELGAQVDAWAIDLLGFGFSDRPADIDYSPETIKTHLYYSWKTLIGQPMVLVGASMGGAAAMEFALAYPEAVAKLVLIDGAGFAKGPAVSKLLQVFPALGTGATNFLRQPQVREKVSRKAYLADQRFVTPDAECCAALHLDLPRWREALIRFTCSGGYYLGDRIAQITQPTLIIWGRQDKILGVKDADRFKRTIGQSKLVWIENCGHVPHLEQPQATAAAILQFVQEIA